MHCSLNNAQVSFHPSDVVTCFLLFGGLVFLFPPTRALSRLPPFMTQVCQWTSVQGQVSFKFSSSISSLNFFFKLYKFKYTFVSQRGSANPQPESAGCGDEYHRKLPIFKKKRECACLQGFTVHVSCTQVTWQLA